MHEIPSSPLTECSGRNSDFNSLEQEYNDRVGSNITDDILEDRKQKHLAFKQPLSSSSPIKENLRERRRDRLRELAREKKTNSYRSDIEQFIMRQEYLRHLQEMEKEAEKHVISLDEIDRLIDEDLDPVLDKKPSVSVEEKPSHQRSNKEKELEDDDDNELIRLIEIQQEYEFLMKQEQQELEETLSSFTL
ncbi:hypothetical protein KLU848_1853 [Kluyveromyces marxianus]